MDNWYIIIYFIFHFFFNCFSGWRKYIWIWYNVYKLSTYQSRLYNEGVSLIMQFCDVFAIEKRCHQIVSTHPVSTEHFWLLLTCFAIYIGYLFIGFDGISSKIYLGNGSVSQFSLFIPSGLLARATDILLLAKGVCISVITPSQLFIFWSFHLRPKNVCISSPFSIFWSS